MWFLSKFQLFLAFVNAIWYIRTIMFTASNILSFLRCPLAFLFLIERVDVRVAAVLVAAFSDIIDGYLARRYKNITKLGTILDPLMDKFFVFFTISILLYEHKLQIWELVAMLSRDVSLVVFAIYLVVMGNLKSYSYKSVICGKIMTALQFVALFLMSLNIYINKMFFLLFFLFGALVLFELFFTLKSKTKV